MTSTYNRLFIRHAVYSIHLFHSNPFSCQ